MSLNDIGWDAPGATAAANCLIHQKIIAGTLDRKFEPRLTLLDGGRAHTSTQSKA
ncbi:MAG: hypothetical protein WBY53_20305 [Acidobacteriaceae bacterium]